MDTNTSNQLGRKDNTALWTVLIIIGAAVIAYAAYIYYPGNRYQSVASSEMGSTNNTNMPATNP